MYNVFYINLHGLFVADDEIDGKFQLPLEVTVIIAMNLFSHILFWIWRLNLSRFKYNNQVFLFFLGEIWRNAT